MMYGVWETGGIGIERTGTDGACAMMHDQV